MLTFEVANPRNLLDGCSLGTPGRQEIQNPEISYFVLSAMHGDLLRDRPRPQTGLGLPHSLHRTANHSLNRLFGVKRRFNRLDLFQIRPIRLDPAPDPAVQAFQVLNNESPRAISIEGKDKRAVA